MELLLFILLLIFAPGYLLFNNKNLDNGTKKNKTCDSTRQPWRYSLINEIKTKTQVKNVKIKTNVKTRNQN